ncbi:MAG TPA: hypothetical protein VGJ60_06980 [Chloroflexota bacterium]
MHADERSGTRYCCWCDLDQHLERDEGAEPRHGARFTGQRYDQRWTPPSNQDDCPREIGGVHER